MGTDRIVNPAQWTTIGKMVATAIVSCLGTATVIGISVGNSLQRLSAVESRAAGNTDRAETMAELLAKLTVRVERIDAQAQRDNAYDAERHADILRRLESLQRYLESMRGSP